MPKAAMAQGNGRPRSLAMQTLHVQEIWKEFVASYFAGKSPHRGLLILIVQCFGAHTRTIQARRVRV